MDAYHMWNARKTATWRTLCAGPKLKPASNISVLETGYSGMYLASILRRAFSWYTMEWMSIMFLMLIVKKKQSPILRHLTLNVQHIAPSFASWELSLSYCMTHLAPSYPLFFDHNRKETDVKAKTWMGLRTRPCGTHPFLLKDPWRCLEADDRKKGCNLQPANKELIIGNQFGREWASCDWKPTNVFTCEEIPFFFEDNHGFMALWYLH